MGWREVGRGGLGVVDDRFEDVGGRGEEGALHVGNWFVGGWNCRSYLRRSERQYHVTEEIALRIRALVMLFLRHFSLVTGQARYAAE